MHRVLVLGAGKIGSLLSGLLAASGDYQIDLGDANGKAAAGRGAGHKLANIKAHQVDASSKAALEAHLKAHPRGGGDLQPALLLQPAGGGSGA